ncbi:DUF58 domain-containing protein [Paraburkholderia rhizosphaerae]|uniref:Uncharacterized protein DUF58 n=1 Tax=Paraburkholderia rhizosphaerae TaxID=480658 RepID=A0A4R8LVF6_9BURK|nr:DUF58 domain-containing protein [Paraburkholderia rhizosphaerae]TDY51800.1 uncharacterized protein DUF58 [Paraburkholderia rhizosphaerae]
MSPLKEFHYRLPVRVAGVRPGSHRGTSVGVGQEFISHARLFDYPDPRRIDIRASIRGGYGEWLVRLHRQRVAVPVYAVVDVSASMRFGHTTSKLDAAAQFAEALGYSAFRHGDRVGMLAFDTSERDDLFLPARHVRGAGALMSDTLRHAKPGEPRQRRASPAAGLEKTLARIAERACMVFLVSDFHWPLDTLAALLRSVPRIWLVPIVLWNSAELEPPATNGWLTTHDMETGERRSIWITDALRDRWRAAVATHRDHISRTFTQCGVQPLFATDTVDADAVSRYFVEQVA